jgi:hypothetical protein
MTNPIHQADDTQLASLPADSGDVGAYFDELIVDFGVVLHASERYEEVADALRMELVGPHLRLAGDIGLGRFRRISDVLNQHEGLLRLLDVAVLRRNGMATRVTTPEMWISPGEVTLFGQADVSETTQEPPPEVRVVKEPHLLVVVTPGHTLTGSVYVPVGAELSVFIESPVPAFIPMTGVRARSLADRRIITSYAFALLNRRHIVAATEMPPSMRAGNWRI